MRFVELYHPRTGGSCRVPETTATNLRKRGWTDPWRETPKATKATPTATPKPQPAGDGEKDTDQ